MQTCLALWWSGGADERDFGSVKKLRRGRKKRGDFDTNLRIKSPIPGRFRRLSASFEIVHRPRSAA